MKNTILFFLLAIFTSTFAQKPEVDTAQIVIPNRKNSPATMDKPYVILISADGFRHDYAQKYNAENLLRLAATGVQADAMIPSFPSITGPNHYTLITGMYPSHTGFVDNYFFDNQRKEYFSMSKKETISDGSWLNGVPLWSLAEQQGMISASLFWVASNSDAGGTRPTYYYDYHEQFSEDQKINILLNWLKLPAEVRPHFITYYFPQVDKNGHIYGPNAVETKDAVKMVDEYVAKIVAKVSALNLPNVNFIFVSDHGMTDVDTENPIAIPPTLLDESRFITISGQTLLRVMVKNEAEVKSVYKKLKKERTSDYKVYLTDKFPKRLHYRTSDDRRHRIGQILLVPKAPKIFLRPGEKTKSGKHGYDPRLSPDMKATFYAWGDAFKPNLKIKAFENVHVYPLLTNILDLKITQPIDGKIEVLKGILK